MPMAAVFHEVEGALYELIDGELAKRAGVEM